MTSSGLPDIDSFTSYGPVMVNFAPVADPTTDEDAAHRNLWVMNVAAMTQTAARAIVRFVGVASAGAATDPSSNVHFSVWGNDVSVKPVVVQTGVTGVYTATWPTTVTDALGNSHTVNLRFAQAWFEGSTPCDVAATVTSPNVVTFRVWNVAGTLVAGTGLTFGIMAY